MSKFLQNLLVQISKAFVYSKIQILFENNFSQISANPAFRPNRGPFLFFLSNWPLHLSPLGLGLSAGPAGPRVGGALPGCRFPHGEAPPATLPSPSLHARLTGGPHLSSSPPARPSLAMPPPPPDAPRAAQLHLGCRPSLYHPAITSPSLIPLLTSPPPSMALTPLTPPLLLRPLLSGAPPGPYKREMRPPALTAPHPLPSELFRALLHPCDEIKPPPFVASGAPPLRHPSVVGEHLPSTASTGSFFPSIAGEHGRAPAPARHAPVRHHRTVDSVHVIFR
jgi:hypothetical protein